MDVETPKVVIPIFCAPKKAPCPHCGKRGKRKRTLHREVRTLAYKTIAVLDITYAEYGIRPTKTGRWTASDGSDEAREGQTRRARRDLGSGVFWNGGLGRQSAGITSFRFSAAASSDPGANRAVAPEAGSPRGPSVAKCLGDTQKHLPRADGNWRRC